jgi:nucleoid-associated protein YgaU
MHRDFKIGLIVGLVLLVLAMGWIAGHESFSPHARLAQEQEVAYPLTDAQEPDPPAEPVNELPDSGTAETMDAAPLPVESDTKIATVPIFSVPQEEVRPEPEALPDPPDEPTYHLVAEGQTLSTIAQIHYGSSAQWKRILDANPTVIRDAHKIRPGMRLMIPPREEE